MWNTLTPMPESRAEMDPFVKPPTISDDYRMAEIYRQSADVFYDKGFEATTMAEIAESVDLTQGGLYYYIKGKKVLLFAIMSYALDLLETEALNPARRLDDPLRSLVTLIGGYVHLISDEPSVMTMLSDAEIFLEKSHLGKIRSRKQVSKAFLRDLIASLSLPKGGLKGIDPEQAAQEALTLIHTVRTWNEGGQLNLDEVVRQILGETLGEDLMRTSVLAS